MFIFCQRGMLSRFGMSIQVRIDVCDVADYSPNFIDTRNQLKMTYRTKICKIDIMAATIP
jgi:hypothetical protein